MAGWQSEVQGKEQGCQLDHVSGCQLVVDNSPGAASSQTNEVAGGSDAYAGSDGPDGQFIFGSTPKRS